VRFVLAVRIVEDITEFDGTQFIERVVLRHRVATLHRTLSAIDQNRLEEHPFDVHRFGRVQHARRTQFERIGFGRFDFFSDQVHGTVRFRPSSDHAPVPRNSERGAGTSLDPQREVAELRFFARSPIGVGEICPERRTTTAIVEVVPERSHAGKHRNPSTGTTGHPIRELKTKSKLRNRKQEVQYKIQLIIQ